MLRLDTMSVALLATIFGVIALLASAFAVVPLLRLKGPTPIKGRHWLALGGGLSVAAIGLATYAALGQPQIALTSLGTPSATDYPALVATLARRMPDRPGDLEGWSLLGRGYVALRNPEQGAKAFAHAIAIARDQNGAPSADLLVDYGEALADVGGGVTDEAEAAFKEAVTLEPQHLIARYYLGRALFERGDKPGAAQHWQAILRDAPPDWPGREPVTNQLAALTAETGGSMPNPEAMVAQLASRLEGNPDDLNGWLMLIRAYSVLKHTDKAAAALARARTVFANQPEAQTALADIAKQFALN